MKIVIVEPKEPYGICESFKRARAHPSGNLTTIMAGLDHGLLSSIARGILKVGVGAVIRIDGEYSRKAMELLWGPSSTGPCVESGGSGAAGLSGVVALRENASPAPVKAAIGWTSVLRIPTYNTEGAQTPTILTKQ